MISNSLFKIVVAETSPIIRMGVIAMLKRIPDVRIQPFEASNMTTLNNAVQLQKPQLVIINPQFEGWFNLPTFKNGQGTSGCKYIALQSTLLDSSLLREYDGRISINDNLEVCCEVITQMLHTKEKKEEPDSEQENLSQREKEIVSCIVKGMTNKAIADELCLSVFTVNTHRRNIVRKLQIHSPAGLTIYAIVNKLVDIKDIKTPL